MGHFLHTGLTELDSFSITRSTFLGGNPLNVYFEVAKKQACNYAENALCYRCFSGNPAKLYRAAIFKELFPMYGK